MSRRLPPLNSLRAAEAVARHLSMARAAEELHVTPAAVSQQVKTLEDMLGRPLFHRGAKGLTLTDAAQEALPLLTQGLDLLERAADRMRACPEVVPLLVSALPAFAARWLIPRLEDFHQSHPGVEIRLTATTRVVDLEREDVDVALRYGPGRYPGLVVERLLNEQAIPVCTPEMAARITEPADLLTMPLIYDDNTAWDVSFPDWETWFRAAGVSGAVPAGRRYGDSFLAQEAAGRGLGVALVRSSLAAADIAAGRLVRLFAIHHPIAYGYHFVCLPRRLHSAKVQVFRDWLRRMASEAKPV